MLYSDAEMRSKSEVICRSMCDRRPRHVGRTSDFRSKSQHLVRIDVRSHALESESDRKERRIYHLEPLELS